MEPKFFGNYIAGLTTDAATGKPREIINPSTELPIGDSVTSRVPEIDAACSAALEAFKLWQATSPSVRSQALLRLAEQVERHADTFVELECMNTGKPVRSMRESEIPGVIDCLRFFAGAGRLLEAKASGEYLPGHSSLVRREPVGVCAQIIPWNYPLNMAVWKMAPAIAAGNTVVMKPSELTPATTLFLGELTSGILPEGVFNVLCGDARTGAELVGHPVPALVSMSGSVEAGIAVAQSAATGLKRVHLELGGKAPAVVFQDADLARSAQGIAEAAFFNAGQDCTAATRALVAAEVADAFTLSLVRAANSLVLGPPNEESSFSGPLISAQQLERVAGFVHRAIEGGSELLAGGHRADGRGYFFPPTVIDNVDQTDEIVQEEVFGPVITIQQFTSESEAVELANDVRFGLSASVWSRDHTRIARVTRRLEAGCVWVNTHLPLVSEMPHGGFKMSGYGKDLSGYSLDEYTRIKHVMSYLGTEDSSIPSPPVP